MNRRQIIAALGSLTAMASVANAHTPFSQWVVYRKKHLLIGAHRADPRTYELATNLAGALADSLPEAKSRVARAPTAQRLASLIGTQQLDVAVLRDVDAVAMRDGVGRFKPYGKIELRLLAELDDHVLVAHSRFPNRHAWLLSAALDRSGLLTRPVGGTEIALHEGSLSFLNGDHEPGRGSD